MGACQRVTECRYTPSNGALDPSRAVSLSSRTPAPAPDDIPGPQYSPTKPGVGPGFTLRSKHSDYEYSGIKPILS